MVVLSFQVPHSCWGSKTGPIILALHPPLDPSPLFREGQRPLVPGVQIPIPSGRMGM